jgi:hypothetical protein
MGASQRIWAQSAGAAHSTPTADLLQLTRTKTLRGRDEVYVFALPERR